MQRQKQQTKKENVMLYLASFKGLFMSGMAGSRCSTMTFGSVFSYKLLCVCVCLCVCAQSLSHVRLFCDPKYRSPPGSCVHEISQARILEWVASPTPTPGDLPDSEIELASLVSPELAGGLSKA